MDPRSDGSQEQSDLDLHRLSNSPQKFCRRRSRRIAVDTLKVNTCEFTVDCIYNHDLHEICDLHEILTNYQIINIDLIPLLSS